MLSPDTVIHPYSAMPEKTQQMKRFNFTIDSLINSLDGDLSRTSRRSSNPVIISAQSTICSRSLVSSNIPEFKDRRTDEEFSKYSDTSGKISPIPHSGSGIDTSRNSYLQETDMGADDVKVRCSTPYADKPNSSRPLSTNCLERSMDKTNTCHKKKSRTAFTTEQLDKLEKRFQSHCYLAANERSDLAEELQLTVQQVKTWFQNRRMKDKRQQKVNQTSTLPFPTGGVDVMQLRALGIPCPSPPGHVTVPCYSGQAFPTMALHRSGHILPQKSSSHLPPWGKVHLTNLPYLPQYGLKYGFNQLAVPHLGPTYPIF